METRHAILSEFRQTQQSDADRINALTRWIVNGYGEDDAKRFIPGLSTRILIAAQENAAHAEFLN